MTFSVAAGRSERVSGSHSWPALFALGSRGPGHSNTEVAAVPALFTSGSLSLQVSRSYLLLSTSEDVAGSLRDGP